MQARALFSNIKHEIISNLRKANKEIKVAVAWLTDEDIIRTLTQRRNDGLDVQIVISDSKENFRNTSKFKEFIRNEGKLFVTSPKFLHHKFCIIDDTTIINGSYNWTYYAQSNEENILIVSVNKTIIEEAKLLNQFIAKHKFFCDKISTLITDTAALNHYKEIGKEVAVILTQLDETEIKLRQELEDDVRISFDKAKALNIGVSSYLLERMQIDGGGVEFIKRILYDEMTTGEMKSGFKKLEEPIPHRVDLSLEYLASRPKYVTLFSKEEIEFCKKQMTKYGL